MDGRKNEQPAESFRVRPVPYKMDVHEVAEFARRRGIEGVVPTTSQRTDRSPSKLIPAGTPTHVFVCGLAGTAVCGGSHLLTTPLDVLKCRIQVNKTKYPTLAAAFRVTVKEEGWRGLVRGFAPTAIGYGLQGFAKFGFYEAFKKILLEKAGPENAYVYRTLIFALAAAGAEAIGDVFLAPFEAAKVRAQTDANAPTAMRRVLPLIWRSERAAGFFKGLLPLWSRQIPYTMSKFLAFEFTVDFLYRRLQLDRQTCSRNEQLQVSLAAGILAGATSAVCSHPPDVIVSQLYKDPTATFGSVIRRLGFRGCWSGLGTRMLMIGGIAACQLFTVDVVKAAFRLEPSKMPQMPTTMQKPKE